MAERMTRERGFVLCGCEGGFIGAGAGGAGGAGGGIGAKIVGTEYVWAEVLRAQVEVGSVEGPERHDGLIGC